MGEYLFKTNHKDGKIKSEGIVSVFIDFEQKYVSKGYKSYYWKNFQEVFINQC